MHKSDHETRTPYAPPAMVMYGSVEEITMMPGGSVGCEGASGKQQRVDTGGDVGGDCDTQNGPN